MAQSADQYLITGTIMSADNTPLSGATIKILNSNRSILSDASGHFSIMLKGLRNQMSISYIGYENKVVYVNSLRENKYNIILSPVKTQLKEVEVSTGYQTLSVNHSTGSISTVENKLFNRKPSSDVISRLENLTPSIQFDRRAGDDNPSFSIRGVSTIYANTQPLIVLDNFPFDGDINSINPNDVESINILKDAAAAAIWGVRAGNGVIVINTKKGYKGQALKMDFASNLTLGEKPNLFYTPGMSTSDFIDVEKKLFESGYYNYDENSLTKNALTPVVELLIKGRDGILTPQQVNSSIDSLRTKDVRNDYEKYYYRKSIYQQYHLNLSGGTQNLTYYVSGGYDRNAYNIKNNDYTRYTLKSAITLNPIRNLTLSAGIQILSTDANNTTNGSYSATSGFQKLIYPYAQLKNDNGSWNNINWDYNTTFINAAISNGYQDWTYNPIQNMLANSISNKNIDNLIKFGIKYNILKGLSVDIKYQNQKISMRQKAVQDESSYSARNLVNQYAQVDASGKVISTPIPPGGIIDHSNNDLTSKTVRAQLNFDKSFGIHYLNIIGGFEVKEEKTEMTKNKLYGYADKDGSSYGVDYITQFLTTPMNIYLKIPFMDQSNYLLDRYKSFYANGAYTLQEKYTFSVSGRIDESNLFGVKTNQKSVPLWHIAGSWLLSKEDFIPHGLFQMLKLRASFGYNGNVDKRTSAFTIVSSGVSDITNLKYLKIESPANPQLRWEKIGILDFGVDFSLSKSRLFGSIDYYIKNAKDLMGYAIIDPTTGIINGGGTGTFYRNLASMKGKGIDLDLGSNVLDKKFKWIINGLFSYNSTEVTKYENPTANISNRLNDGRSISPIVGKPLNAIFSYKWAGLDPQNGNPQVYLDGKISSDYVLISKSTNTDNLVYSGPALPTIFGSVRNTFLYKEFSLSTTISYKFGYYFRTPSISYNDLITQRIGVADYSKRWQKPGDEKITNVPSFPANNDPLRDFTYQLSDVLVRKGDHIRLSDIVLSYDIPPTVIKTVKIQVGLFANNLGLIWCANKEKRDPDYIGYFTLPQPKSFGLNLKISY